MAPARTRACSRGRRRGVRHCCQRDHFSGPLDTGGIRKEKTVGKLFLLSFIVLSLGVTGASGSASTSAATGTIVNIAPPASPARAVAAASCRSKDDAWARAMIPAHERTVAAERTQRQLIAQNAKPAVRLRAQLAVFDAYVHAGEVSRSRVPCSKPVRYLRLLFIRAGTLALEAKTALQAYLYAVQHGSSPHSEPGAS